MAINPDGSDVASRWQEIVGRNFVYVFYFPCHYHDFYEAMRTVVIRDVKLSHLGLRDSSVKRSSVFTRFSNCRESRHLLSARDQLARRRTRKRRLTNYYVFSIGAATWLAGLSDDLRFGRSVYRYRWIGKSRTILNKTNWRIELTVLHRSTPMCFFTHMMAGSMTC